MKLVWWILALVLEVCAPPKMAACMARCQRFSEEASLCRMMCTSRCEALNQSFGIAVADCRSLQEGDGEVVQP